MAKRGRKQILSELVKKKIDQLYMAGLTQAAIVSSLNDEGLTTSKGGLIKKHHIRNRLYQREKRGEPVVKTREVAFDLSRAEASPKDQKAKTPGPHAGTDLKFSKSHASASENKTAEKRDSHEEITVVKVPAKVPTTKTDQQIEEKKQRENIPKNPAFDRRALIDTQAQRLELYERSTRILSNLEENLVEAGDATAVIKQMRELLADIEKGEERWVKLMKSDPQLAMQINFGKGGAPEYQPQPGQSSNFDKVKREILPSEIVDSMKVILISWDRSFEELMDEVERDLLGDVGIAEAEWTPVDP